MKSHILNMLHILGLGQHKSHAERGKKGDG
jgi:hypothetical protein